MPCPHNHEALKRDDAAWSQLAYVGVQKMPGTDERWEVRNCSCRSTLYRAIDAAKEAV